ncbi:MAG: sulfite exporter TauE/SafE family protein [Clostridiales Family XIII bacterium]|jgi:sulfite exporter TauE/SafE/copper chaperone CopZ|nr:sulfite exporter TauE/SafE family protein [Clostridiales Family XIII bacterium]
MTTVNRQIYIGGMTCISCQTRIEKKLKNTEGIEDAVVSYADGNAAVSYDDSKIGPKKIAEILKKLGYSVLDRRESSIDKRQLLGILIIVVVVYVLVNSMGLNTATGGFPLAKEGMGYGMLFVIGLLTSVHCIAMCGGINISQCIPAISKVSGRDAEKKSVAVLPGIFYNGGRVISYTIVGAIVGGLGSLISLDGMFKGMIQLIAGIFMLIMGLNMLGVFLGLRRLVPHLPKGIANRIENGKSKSRSPFIIGLLNGLMPCGPLQAMQLYALSTASPGKGALSMFLFALGTVPLMFGLGVLSSLLTKKFTKRIMTIGAVLVMILGLFMFSNGWNLSGLPDISAHFSGVFSSQSGGAETESVGVIEGDLQTIHSTLTSGTFPAITVTVGVPVRWVIDAPPGSVNGCNYRILIPEYGLEHEFSEGENVIEFLPEKTGTFKYSCWMGMIRSTITVVAQ